MHNWFTFLYSRTWPSLVASVLKNPTAHTGDIGDASSIPGSGRSPGGEHGNPPVFLPGESLGQRSGATAHRVAESDKTKVT